MSDTLLYNSPPYFFLDVFILYADVYIHTNTHTHVCTCQELVLSFFHMGLGIKLRSLVLVASTLPLSHLDSLCLIFLNISFEDFTCSYNEI